MSNYKQSLIKLHKFCKKESYKGYSLYDSHNGIIPFEKMGNTISFLANQVVKRSPINFRSFLGIKKGINPKGVGLFLLSYSKMKHLDIFDDSTLDELNSHFFKWLVNNPSEGYSGHCWGYNYDWPHRTGDLFPKNTPSSVVTGFNCRAIMAYYDAYKDERAKEVIHSAAQFIKNDIPLTETEFGLCYSYTPVRRDLTVNASLLAAEVLAYDDYLHGSQEHNNEIQGVLDFTKHFQNEDGSWYYKHELDTYKPKDQIDFHQGYVIEIMDIVLRYSGIKDENAKESIKKGLDFYYNTQFNKEEGWAYWRLPKKYPIDIHNQSQAIITFSKFSEYSEEYLPFAQRVADWTIEHMRSINGNFYYQKYPLMTNKVNYLRWNQGWMMVALTTLLEKLSQQSK